MIRFLKVKLLIKSEIGTLFCDGSGRGSLPSRAQRVIHLSTFLSKTSLSLKFWIHYMISTPANCLIYQLQLILRVSNPNHNISNMDAVIFGLLLNWIIKIDVISFLSVMSFDLFNLCVKRSRSFKNHYVWFYLMINCLQSFSHYVCITLPLFRSFLDECFRPLRHHFNKV